MLFVPSKRPLGGPATEDEAEFKNSEDMVPSRLLETGPGRLT